MKKTEPKLIFRQFGEPWNRKRIKEILKIKNGKSQKKIEDKNGKYPILATGGVIGHTNSYLYDKESILIGRKGTIDKPKYMNYPFWTVDTLFYSEIKKDYDAKFIYDVFQTIKWKKYNTSTGVPSLTSRNIENILIYSPQTLNEQQKIGLFFEKLDQLIQLQSDKLEHLKINKKGYLQKLFSLSNKRKPLLRFKNFNNSWVNTKISDLLRLSNLNEVEDPTKYNLLTVKLHFKGIDPTNKKPRKTEKGRKYYFRKSGELIIGKQNFQNGGFGIAKDNVDGLIASNAILSLDFKNSSNKLFIYNSMTRKVWLQKTTIYLNGTGQKEYSTKTILNLNIDTTNINEQNKIGKFLSIVDQQIDLQQQKLDNLKQQKKSYLQKMFI